MALVFAATIANRWFVHRRGLVMGILTAGSATGQLIFLPPVAVLADSVGWRPASLVVATAALLAVPVVWLVLRDYPKTGAYCRMALTLPHTLRQNGPQGAP